MKKVLIPFVSLLLAIFMSSEIAIAQGGNLQFNQVINITPGVSYTVPAGKVFKIESITSNNVSVTSSFSSDIQYNVSCKYCYYSSFNYLTIGNLQFSAQANDLQSWCQPTPCPSTNTSNFNISTLTLPIWLKDGKSLILSSNISGVLITGIEFNITN